MTAVAHAPATVPVPGSPAWREVYPVPRDVRLDVGPWCPIDESALLIELRGWVCPTCLAWWDHSGQGGRWVVAGTVLEGEVVDVTGRLLDPHAQRRRLDRALAVTIAAGAVIGAGAGTGWATRAYAAAMPQQLFIAAAALVTAGTALALALALLRRWWTGRGWLLAELLEPAVREVPDAR